MAYFDMEIHKDELCYIKDNISFIRLTYGPNDEQLT